MNSTIIFQGVKNTWYLYDQKNKYLLNIHPIIEQIHSWFSLGYHALKKKLTLLDKSASVEEFEYYYNKYLFLRSSGFFLEIDVGKLLSGKVTPKLIKQHLCDLDQVVFQVTSECNFQCKYCCFGDLYNSPRGRPQKMDFTMVEKVFEYLSPFWNSRKNSSYDNVISIGFYGGEPLLNIRLIKQIVSYCSCLELNNNARFVYNMTTNAMLLPKYIDFLVENNFNLLISLDGNEHNDSYRVDKKSRPTFRRVFDNINYVYKKFPQYFKEKVEFNSVLTDRATVEEIHSFIYSKFSKIPLIDTLSTTDVRENKIHLYKQMSQIYYEDISMTESRKSRSAKGRELARFFYYNLNNSYRRYADLMAKTDELSQRVPSGTCLPFWKKMYITSEGNIMVCEKIAMKHILGHLTSSGVKLNFSSIANLYNKYYKQIRKQCVNCYLINSCPVCLFQLKFEKEHPVCPYESKEDDYRQYLKKIVSVLEENPNLFFDFNKVTFV